MRLRGLLGGHGGVHPALAAVDDVLQPLDLTPRHDVGVAPVQLFLGLQLVDRLLQRALRLLDLALGRSEVGSGHDHRGVDLGDLAAGRLERGFLLGAVEPEDAASPFFTSRSHADIDFGTRPTPSGRIGIVRK